MAVTTCDVSGATKTAVAVPPPRRSVVAASTGRLTATLRDARGRPPPTATTRMLTRMLRADDDAAAAARRRRKRRRSTERTEKEEEERRRRRSDVALSPRPASPAETPTTTTTTPARERRRLEKEALRRCRERADVWKECREKTTSDAKSATTEDDDAEEPVRTTTTDSTSEPATNRGDETNETDPPATKERNTAPPLSTNLSLRPRKRSRRPPLLASTIAPGDEDANDHDDDTTNAPVASNDDRSSSDAPSPRESSEAPLARPAAADHRHPEPYGPIDLERALTDDTVPSSTTNQRGPPPPPSSRRRGGRDVNDNFVRLNLRNTAGSCRGAADPRKGRRRFSQRRRRREEDEERTPRKSDGTVAETPRSRVDPVRNPDEGVDVLDDYLDGAHRVKKSRGSSDDVPRCPRHGRPCRLRTVKSNRSGNRHRKFYCCSLPRGEQCDFFQWKEDVVDRFVDGASDFVARRVRDFGQRLRGLTVPELKEEARRRGLDAPKTREKKAELLARIMVWARDEVVRGGPTNAREAKETKKKENDETVVRCPVANDAVKNESANDGEDETDGATSQDATEKRWIELDDDDDDSTDDDDSDDDSDDVSIDQSSPPLPKQEEPIPSFVKDDPLHRALWRLCGHASFREGQEWAIRRCLDERRSMLVAPTGSGKSLCYLLPTALRDTGLTIVVSPLLSLAEDQLRRLPPSVPAASLSGSRSASATAAVVDDLVNGRLRILFLSPERLTDAAFARLLRPRRDAETGARERPLPPVSLLCVDEAHCLSQWGHSFRPAYRRLRSTLSLLAPRVVLALTATATPAVVQDVRDTLGVDEVRVVDDDRTNVDVAAFATRDDDDRRATLCRLLSQSQTKTTTDGLLASGPVVVYVWRQRDTESVAERLVAHGVAGGVVFYHGGMDADTRQRAQSKFLRGKARVIVATVAFGLGIDKPDVTGIVHMFLPPSVENYLQEIGRAGRDGRKALAVALTCPEDVRVRLSLARADLLTRCQIRCLVRVVRREVREAVAAWRRAAEAPDGVPSSLDVALRTSSLSDAVDGKEETLETVLSSLGGDALTVAGSLRDRGVVTLRRRPLEALAAREPVAKAMSESGGGGPVVDAAGRRGRDAYAHGERSFSAVAVARRLGPDAGPRHVFAALRRLQRDGELELALDRGASWRLRADRALVARCLDDDDDLEDEVEAAARRAERAEEETVRRVLDARRLLVRLTEATSVDDVVAARESTDDAASPRADLLRAFVRDYFSRTEGPARVEDDPVPSLASNDRARIRGLVNDVATLLRNTALVRRDTPTATSDSYESVRFGDADHVAYTARAATRILHAVGSPRAPVRSWYSHPLWGRWRDVSFPSLSREVERIVARACVRQQG